MGAFESCAKIQFLSSFNLNFAGFQNRIIDNFNMKTKFSESFKNLFVFLGKLSCIPRLDYTFLGLVKILNHSKDMTEAFDQLQNKGLGKSYFIYIKKKVPKLASLFQKIIFVFADPVLQF